jgi:putative flippase GtrA
MPRYALASAFSFAFIIGATAGLHEVLGVSETLSPAIAMVAALVVNFTLLRVWVFPGQTVHWGRQFAETVVTSAAFRLLEYGIFLVLHLGFDVNYLIATGVSVCLSALGKFGVYREVVFKRGRAASVADPAPDPR